METICTLNGASACESTCLCNVNLASMARSNHYAPLHMRAKKESWKNITLFLYLCEILET